jgi:hypothetical protein
MLCTYQTLIRIAEYGAVRMKTSANPIGVAQVCIILRENFADLAGGAVKSDTHY